MRGKRREVKSGRQFLGGVKTVHFEGGGAKRRLRWKKTLWKSDGYGKVVKDVQSNQRAGSSSKEGEMKESEVHLRITRMTGGVAENDSI